MVILLLLNLLGLILLFRLAGASLRLSVIQGALLWGGILVLMSEVLSLFQQLNRVCIAGSWCLVLAINLAFLFRLISRNRKRGLSVRQLLVPRSAEDETDTSLFHPRAETRLVWGVVAIVCLLLLIALVAPPTNHDSMTYHMTRVMHWIQNGSLEHYPTSIDRQLYNQPFAEMVILHFQILSGTDRFANMPQWLAMVGSVICVSLIAKEFGATRLTQCLASIWVVTLPMGILQSSSTQNDYVASFLFVCFLYYAWQLCKDSGETAVSETLCWTALAFGLGCLTKMTFAMYAAPFALAVVIRTLWRRQFWPWRSLVLAVTICGSLAGPHSMRNLRVFGHPTANPTAVARLSMRDRSAGAIASNVLRNSALHLATRHATWNDRVVEASVRKIHQWFGVDPDNELTTHEAKYFSLEMHWNHEDFAGNLPHFLLGIVAFAFLLTHRDRSGAMLQLYAGGLLLGGLIFCSLIVWMPWNSRLQLPLFVAAAVPAAMSFERLAGRRTLIYLATGLLIVSIPWVFDNQTRPLKGSMSILWKSRADLRLTQTGKGLDEIRRAIEYVAEHHPDQPLELGLNLTGSTPEYRIWTLADDAGLQKLRLTHVSLDPNSVLYVPQNRQLDLILSSRKLPPAAGVEYRIEFQDGDITVLSRSELARHETGTELR